MKYKYRYSLEKHKNGKRKHICPQCGKRRFVRYIDNLTNQYVADHVGMCDRRESCKYHLHPYNYLNNNCTGKFNGKNAHYKTNIPKAPVIDSLPFSYAKKFSQRKENNLNSYLYRIFGEDKVNEVNNIYFVGSTKNKMTIFPLIDANEILRSAKFMYYNSETGKRLRDGSYAYDWLHTALSRKGMLPENFVLKTCLFGEHLIRLEENNDKIICIVESEKTAIISALCIPECLFMATGSRENLTINRLKPLKGRKIRIYPDTSADGSTFEKWKKRADEARLLGFDISISDFLEKNCTDEQKEDGYDIADYLVDRVLKLRQVTENQTTETQTDIQEETAPQNTTDNQSDTLKDFIKRNPAVKSLIDRLNLVEV